MGTYQNKTSFASNSYAVVSNDYLQWAYGAATFNRPAPLINRDVYGAIHALTHDFGGIKEGYPETSAIPQERRLKWLEKVSELSGRDVLPGSGDQLSDYWLHRLIGYAKPPEYPSRHDWEYQTRRGDVMKEIDPNARNYKGSYEDFKREWFCRDRDDDEKRMARDWLALTDQYLPCPADEKRADEDRTDQCPPSRRLAFVIEMTRFYQRSCSPAKPLDIASFFDEMLAQWKESDEEEELPEEAWSPRILPRCLLELKGKSPAELDAIVAAADPKILELEALAMPLEMARAATPEPTFLFDRLLPDGRVTIALGDNNAGKTYFALELASATALGRPAFGHFPATRKGAVIMFAGESPDNIIHSRLVALEQTYGPIADRFVIVPRALPLDDEAMRVKYVEAIRLYAERFKAQGIPLALVINDTLKRSIGEQDANSNAVAARFTKTFEGIAADHGCAVLVNAHTPARGDTIAGSKDYANAADWVLYIQGSHSGDLLTGVRVEQGGKARVGTPITPFRVRCQPVALPGGHSDVVLVDYAEIATKRKKSATVEPEKVPLPEIAQELVVDLAGNFRADVAALHAQGKSGSEIAKLLQRRKVDVLKALTEIRNGG